MTWTFRIMALPATRPSRYRGFFIIWMICLVLCRPTTVLLSVSCYHRIVMYSLTDISGYLLLLCTTIHSIPLLYSVSSLEGNDERMRWTSSWKSKRALSSFAWLASRCLATTDQCPAVSSDVSAQRSHRGRNVNRRQPGVAPSASTDSNRQPQQCMTAADRLVC